MIKALLGIFAHRRVNPVADVTPPSAPVLSSGTTTATTIPLTWTAATDNVGVSGYDVYVNNVFNGSSVTTSYTVTGLTASTQYTIFIKAKDAAGNMTNSNTITPTTGATDPVSMPAVEGYGVNVTGHAGAPGGAFTTYTVTTTAATGTGSLMAGLGSNRRIIFSVSGTINQRFEIGSMTNLTVDGTTAPYPGITITTTAGNAGFSIAAGCSNIIIQGLTFANCKGTGTGCAAGCGADGLNVVDSAHDVLVRHCFAYGNYDGNIDFAADCYNITMQYCVIGNHVYGADHNTGGTLITGSLVSAHHNFFYPRAPNPDEGERFPFTHRNYGTPQGVPDSDVRSNLIWDFGRGSTHTGSGFGVCVSYGAKGNAVNNYAYTPGSNTDNAVTNSAYGEPIGQLYAIGNISGNGVNANVDSNHAEWPIPAQFQIANDPACIASAKIRQFAGPTQRNPVDGTREPIIKAYFDDLPATLPQC